jgi:hypothetical protein
MNASVVRILVPAGAWRASSVRGSHTAHASSRALTQTRIPTPKTKRLPPFPAGICAVSHLPSPHSTGPGPPASKGASNGRQTGESNLAVERERRLGFPWRVRGTGASAGRCASRNARPDSGLSLEYELGARGVPSRACSGSTPRSTSGPELADRRNAALDRNLFTACAGRTIYESSKMSNVGILIDRIASVSYWISSSSCFTLSDGVGQPSWSATILACSLRNP